MEEGRQAAEAETLRENESPSPPLASMESRPKDFGFTNFRTQPSPCLTPVSRKSGRRWMDPPLIFSCHQNWSLLSLELPDTSDTPRGGFVHIPPFQTEYRERLSCLDPGQDQTQHTALQPTVPRSKKGDC